MITDLLVFLMFFHFVIFDLWLGKIVDEAVKKSVLHGRPRAFCDALLALPSSVLMDDQKEILLRINQHVYALLDSINKEPTLRHSLLNSSFHLWSLCFNLNSAEVDCSQQTAKEVRHCVRSEPARTVLGSTPNCGIDAARLHTKTQMQCNQKMFDINRVNMTIPDTLMSVAPVLGAAIYFPQSDRAACLKAACSAVEVLTANMRLPIIAACHVIATAVVLTTHSTEIDCLVEFRRLSETHQTLRGNDSNMVKVICDRVVGSEYCESSNQSQFKRALVRELIDHDQNYSGSDIIVLR